MDNNCRVGTGILGGSDVITADMLCGRFDNADADMPSAAPTLGSYLADTERRYIEQALTRNGGRISDTAAELGISRKNLWEKMRKLEIPGSSGDSGATA